MNTTPSLPDHVPAPGVSEALRAIGEPTRVRIIEYLRQGERCVCELGSAIGLSADLDSHHLKVLKASGLIAERRAGRWVYYSLAPDRLEQVRGWIDRLLVATNDARPAAEILGCTDNSTPAKRQSGHASGSPTPVEIK